MSRALILAAAAVQSLGLAAPARADTQAGATLTDIRIQLVDLDPGDGIAPSMTFLDSSSSTAVTSAFALTYPPTAGRSSRSSTEPFGPVSATSTATRTGAAGAVQGDFSAGASMQASAFASLAALGKAVGSADIGDADGPRAYEPRFMLSPETALYVSGLGDVDASASDPDHEYAYAIIVLGLDSGIAGAPVSEVSIEVDAGKGDQPPTLGHYAGPLAARLINDSSAAVLGDLTLLAYASADSHLDAPPSAVPEPGGGVLAGGGGLLLVALTRLRRRPQDARVVGDAPLSAPQGSTTTCGAAPDQSSIT